MRYQFDLHPTDADVEEVRAGLIQHNTPFLAPVRRDRIACYAFEDERRVGGIVAEIWGHWLLIRFMWVHEDRRGSGVGSALLERLEDHARTEGCLSALVDTFSFQAQPFYERHGYRCRMVLENYPVDTTLTYLDKTL
ncbi:MAG: N-acetyltransferase [Spirochaetaceae bacterium]|nr:MAG: N-acetyltransferase [Spirochaetaceae bacterium]